MPRVVLRSAFVVLPLALATSAWWAGCSSEPPASASEDAGRPDTATGSVDAAPAVGPAADGSAPRDCAADLEPDGLATHLECSGLYADFAAKTVAAEARPFTPGVEFWSDGAEKARFLYLPKDATIDITDFDAWKLPVGTKVWKELKLDGKRIETRLFAKTAPDTWRHTTYRWTDDESNAVRKEGGEKVARAGKAPYEIPNAGQCESCHNGGADRLLGVEAVGLGLSTAKGVTLATLAAEGRFNMPPPATTLTIPDAHGGTAAPALGWLHANCGGCHARKGATPSTLFLRLRTTELLAGGGAAASVEELDAFTTSVGVPSKRLDLDAGTLYARIAPGSPETSLAAMLSGARAAPGSDPSQSVQMPPLVSRAVDPQGQKLFEDWIRAIP